jgi:hypothetical protein
MISLLYKDYLVLAIAEKSDQIYVIRAVIGLGEVRLEEVDNGRGEYLYMEILILIALHTLWYLRSSIIQNRQSG